MKLITALVVFVLAAVAHASSDADYWIAKGKENAEKDLEQFDPILKRLTEGDTRAKADLAKQLKFLEYQITEADKNNHKLIPRIEKVISGIDYLSRGKPNFFKRVGLKSLVCFVDGRRDNKSYYVLDGAQNWIHLRIPILAKYSTSSQVISMLASDLETIKHMTEALRDQLDAMAQKFVQGIKSLHKLTEDDVEKNLAEIQSIAAQLKVDFSKAPEFVENSKKLFEQIDTVVKHNEQ